MVSAVEKLRQLRRELKEHKTAIDDLESEIHKFYRLAVQEAADAKVDEFIQIQRNNPSGLNRTLIRDLLCWDNESEDIGLQGTNITLHGSGPWIEDELQDFLTEKDFSVTSIDDLPSILVIGDFDVEKDAIHRYISFCLDSRKPPRIYTQELFVYWLAKGEDPLEALENETLIDIVEGHGGMEIVLEHESVKWPEISLNFFENSTVTEFDTEDWGSQSILFKFGYNAREGDLSAKERRSILRDVYEHTLVNFFESDADRIRWGSAKSSQRLYAISHFLAWLLNLQGSTKPAAAEKWNSDLSWLKVNFFNKQMKFRWPNQDSPVEPKRIRREITDPRRLKIGKRVFHEKYGWGRVTTIKNVSGQKQISIKFDNDGPERTFDMERARILA